MELESKLYRLEETIDAMKKSLFDLESIQKKNNKLVEILKDDTDFIDFVQRLNKQTEEYKTQYDIVTEDLKLMEELVDTYKNDEKIAHAIDLCFTALIKN